MARKYSKSASRKVARAMHERKEGTLRSGPGGRAGKVKSRKQAIAIGLSEARREGAHVPPKKTGAGQTTKSRTARKGARTTARKSSGKTSRRA